MKKRKFLSIIFILSMFLIGIVTAADSTSIGCDPSGWKGWGELHQNKTICVTCPTCDFINFTSVNPDGEVFLNNVEMVKDGSSFCYEYTGQQLNQLGTFQLDGYSQLDSPLGLCFDITITGKQLSVGSYIISIIFILLLFVGVVWLNRKFDSKELEKLYNKIVVEYFKFKDNKSKGNMAYALLFTLAYAILKMIFVLYYLVIVLFLFIFNELIMAYSINTFSSLMPQLLTIALYSLALVGFVFIAVLYEVIRKLVKQISLLEF